MNERETLEKAMAMARAALELTHLGESVLEKGATPC